MKGAEMKLVDLANIPKIDLSLKKHGLSYVPDAKGTDSSTDANADPKKAERPKKLTKTELRRLER